MAEDPSADLSAGDVVAERFELVARLGKGGMGTVWRCRHLTLASDVALKLLDPAIASSPEGRARFKREAQAAAGIRSPHVVQILDHGVHEQTPFIVMELLEGEALSQRLDRGALSLAETSQILVQVGRAISKAHAAGVVHRDLKPDNIFIVKNDDEEVVKVLDFGIAKARFDQAAEDTTRTGAILGTPHYMSPEQLRGDKSLDHRADIWALGIIAYECVTQAKPFISANFPDLVIKICSEDPPPPSSKVTIPQDFDAWFAKSTARDPGQRFGSVREQIHALRAIAEPSFDAARALAGEREEVHQREPRVKELGRLAAPAISEVALDTQHGTANTRPIELTNKKPSRTWVWALGALVVAAAGVAVASVGTKLTQEPLSASGAAQTSSFPPESSSGATVARVPASANASAGASAESEPSSAPSATPSPPNPVSPTLKLQPTVTAKASTQAKPTSPPAAHTAPKPGSQKPASTATGPVDLGI
ncbi:MAG: protein kinase [Polyangiaceae bacterium]|nr:protein kinase [Polyangiaceae bacterium]